MNTKKQIEIIQQALGQASAIFMTQETRGVDIVMPTDELIKIANKVVAELNEEFLVGALTPLGEKLEKTFDDQFFASTQGRNDIRRKMIARFISVPVCEKNCPDYKGMEILHREKCECSCHNKSFSTLWDN